MTDKELYELVRENYNKANKEYLNEQMHKACKTWKYPVLNATEQGCMVCRILMITGNGMVG